MKKVGKRLLSIVGIILLLLLCIQLFMISGRSQNHLAITSTVMSTVRRRQPC